MAFWDNLWGSDQGAFDDFANQMRDRSNQYNPIVDAGNRARGVNQGQYDQLINNPNFIQDKVSSGFYESPYQRMMQDMVQRRMNYNSANTNMLGSGAANRAMQNELTSMTGQFQNDYINRGLASYGMGISGNQGLMEQGMQGMGAQDNLLDQAAGAQLKGQQSANQAPRNMWGTIIGGLGGAASGFMSGGWPGAVAGGARGVMGNPNSSTRDIYHQAGAPIEEQGSYI